MNQDSDKEIGIIVDKNGDSVTVELVQTGECDNCSGRFLCNIGGNGKRKIKIKYDGQISSGELVEIEKVGQNILKISLIQYGIPLLFFISSISLSYSLLKTKISDGYPELISFCVGIFVVILSGFLIKYIFSKISRKDLTMFKIVRVIKSD